MTLPCIVAVQSLKPSSHLRITAVVLGMCAEYSLTGTDLFPFIEAIKQDNTSLSM